MDANWIAAIATAVGVPITLLGIIQVAVSAHIQSHAASKSATIEYIMREITDADLMHARQRLDVAAASTVDGPPRDIPYDERPYIETMLGYHEATAIALIDKTIDEHMYRKWARSRWQTVYRQLRPFIQKLRKGDHAAYEHIEEIARRWELG